MNVTGREQNYFHDLAEIEQLVQNFESCSIEPSEFNHHAHLTVAFWYLSQLPAPAAVERMRAGLHRFTKHHNSDGYHETLTRFWLKLVRHFLDRAETTHSLTEQANELLTVYDHSRLVFEYYSRERIESGEAKQSWVEPDLKPLDF
ncbi:MAG: hypothetical protein ACR2G4_05395 [Pyrinomonadaceae bacterium]